MFENCLALEREYADLEQQMSDPALHADPAAARRVGKRHAHLRPVVAAYRRWLQLGEDEAAAAFYWAARLDPIEALRRE